MLYLSYDAMWFSDLVCFVESIASVCRVELPIIVRIYIVFDMF